MVRRLVGFIRVLMRRMRLVDRQRMVEGRNRSIRRAVVTWELPGVGDRRIEAANDRLALGGNGLCVGVLVAHHDQNFAVEGESVVEGAVAILKATDGLCQFLKFCVV